MTTKTLLNNTNYDKIDNIAVYFLFLGYLIDLSGKMGIRFFFVYPSIFYLLIRSFYKPISLRYFLYFLFCFLLYPFLLSFISFILNENFELILSQYLATFQMVIIFLAIKDFDPIKLLNQFLNSIFYLQVFSLTVFVGCILNISVFLNLIEILGRPFNGGYFGFLRVGEFALPQLYFKSTLIFVFPAIFYFYKKKYNRAFISLLTLVLALSKSGSMLAIVGILFFIAKRRKIYDVFFIIIIILFAFYFGESYLENYINLSDSYTAEVRRSQYSWFINFVIDEPLKFLFGSGFGNSININNTEVVALELDHIDTIRKYGFFWFMIVFAPSFIICIINLFKSRNAGVVVAYIFTFVAVGTNPLLLTSVFFILSFVVFRIISSFNLNE